MLRELPQSDCSLLTWVQAHAHPMAYTDLQHWHYFITFYVPPLDLHFVYKVTSQTMVWSFMKVAHSEVKSLLEWFSMGVMPIDICIAFVGTLGSFFLSNT